MGQYVEQGYQFDLTAPQINDILLMARNFSRPNLLHNSRLLVNQRNRTFPYKDTSKSSDFVLDRWRKNSNQLKIVATNIGGAVGEFGACKNLIDENTNPQGNCVIAQRIWAPRDDKVTSNILFDKDITMSILTYEYGLKSVTGHMIASIPSDAIEGASLWSISIEDGNTTLAKLNFINNNKTNNGIPICADMMMTIYAQPSGITLIAAKVEIGADQTLAIKVGNKWELIDQYNYYKDLNACQRFYKKEQALCACCVGTASGMTGYWTESAIGRFNGPVNMIMRPTINVLDNHVWVRCSADGTMTDKSDIYIDVDNGDIVDIGIAYFIANTDCEYANFTCRKVRASGSSNPFPTYGFFSVHDGISATNINMVGMQSSTINIEISAEV